MPPFSFKSANTCACTVQYLLCTYRYRLSNRSEPLLSTDLALSRTASNVCLYRSTARTITTPQQAFLVNEHWRCKYHQKAIEYKRQFIVLLYLAETQSTDATRKFTTGFFFLLPIIYLLRSGQEPYTHHAIQQL